MSRFAAGNFIDLIDEDNAHLLGALHRGASDLIHIEQLVFFFLDQVFERIGHGHFAFLFFFCCPNIPERTSLILTSISSTPWLEIISKEGMERSRTSRSTMR